MFFARASKDRFKTFSYLQSEMNPEKIQTNCKKIGCYCQFVIQLNGKTLYIQHMMKKGAAATKFNEK